MKILQSVCLSCGGTSLINIEDENSDKCKICKAPIQEDIKQHYMSMRVYKVPVENKEDTRVVDCISTIAKGEFIINWLKQALSMGRLHKLAEKDLNYLNEKIKEYDNDPVLQELKKTKGVE